MQIDLDKLRYGSDFIVEERYIPKYGNLYLICPKKSKHQWQTGEHHLRSLLVNADGVVVSAGLPKFFNFHEVPKDEVTIKSMIKWKRVILSKKVDDTLILRDVLFPTNGGKPFVHFRTRGHHDLGEFHDQVMKLVPYKLLDPTYRTEATIAMGYISPDNKIIVDYKESALVFLGEIDYYHHGYPTLRSHTKETLIGDAEEMGLAPMEFYDVPDTIEGIKELAKSLDGEEGLCLRGMYTTTAIVPGGTIFTTPIWKFKNPKYVLEHALQHGITPKRMKMLLFAYDVDTIQDLRDHFSKWSFDAETAEVYFPQFFKLMKELNTRENHLVKHLRTIKNHRSPTNSRKDNAQIVDKYIKINGCKDLHSTLIYYLNGDRDSLEQSLYSYVYGIKKASYKLFIEEALAVRVRFDRMASQAAS